MRHDDTLPSVETTMRFLALCERYGSEESAVAAVVRGRRAGVPGLPCRDDWPTWNAAEMRAAVDYTRAGRRRGDRIRRAGSVAAPSVWAAAGGGCSRISAAGAKRRQLALEEQVTMSSSGILDALCNEERSLKSQLVAIQRAIEAIEGSGAPTARRGRHRAHRAHRPVRRPVPPPGCEPR